MMNKKNYKTKKYIFDSSFNNDYKNKTISSPIIQSCSTKNTIYLNKIKNKLLNKVDYSDYFKINNNKNEKYINININNLKEYTIQTHKMHTKKNIRTENNTILNRSVNNDKFKNINTINTSFDNKKLYDNKNFYNNNTCKSNIFTNKKKKYIIYNNDITNNDIKIIYNKERDIINNDINNNIKKIKKQEELLKLKKILLNLKEQNIKMKNELNILKDKNLKKENIKKNKNKQLYIDIKDIFSNTEKNIKNNNSQININDLLNFYKFKFGASSSLKEKIIFLRNIYLNEKLKNSLVEKTYRLFLDNKIFQEDIKNNSNTNNIDINNIWKKIKYIIDDINKIKKYNKKLKENINNYNVEKNLYNFYFNNWINFLGVKTKENLKKKINDLIKDENYNDIEETKLYNILMNKQS